MRRALEGQNAPSPFLGEILSHAYRHAEQGDAWAEWVRERTEAAEARDKAFWLLIRGHAEAARFTPFDPARGYAWIRKALQSAREDAARLAVVRELVRYHCDGNRPETALRVIDDNAGKGASEESRKELRILRDMVSLEMQRKTRNPEKRQTSEALAGGQSRRAASAGTQ